MTQQIPPGYWYPGQYTGPGNYSANAQMPQSSSSIFGDIGGQTTPYLGGSPMALDTYLGNQRDRQVSLQQAAVNATAYGTAPQAPQADYTPANYAAAINETYGNNQLTQAQQLAAQGANAYQQGQQAYGQMGQATDLARSAALGQQPSAAEIQQSQGIAQAQRGNLAAAASTRGGAAQQAAAAQAAQMNNSNLGNLGISANAALRANEMAQNRAQYLGATQAQQQAAQGLTGLSLQQQQQAFNQGATQTSLGLQEQAALGGQAQFNAQMQQAQRGQNEQYSLGLEQQGLGYGQLGLSAMQSQLAAQTSQNAQQLQAQQAANQANTNFATGIMGGVGGLLGGIFSDIKAKKNVQPVGGAQPAQTAQQPALQVAPQAATQVAPPVTIAPQQAPAPAAPQVYGMTKDQAKAFLKGQPWQVQTGPAVMDPSYTVAVGPAQMDNVTSDKDTKADRGEATHVADEYLDHLAKSASTYSYKDPAQAPAERPVGAKFGGVMAQDLESVPEIGKQLVSDTPRGKALEGPANLSALLMGVGRLHERLKAMEASSAAR